MILVNVENVSVHFTLKTEKKRAILYEKLCMKLYMSDEILLGLKNQCDKLFENFLIHCALLTFLLNYDEEREALVIRSTR